METVDRLLVYKYGAERHRTACLEHIDPLIGAGGKGVGGVNGESDHYVVKEPGCLLFRVVVEFPWADG